MQFQTPNSNELAECSETIEIDHQRKTLKTGYYNGHENNQYTISNFQCPTDKSPVPTEHRPRRLHTYKEISGGKKPKTNGKLQKINNEKTLSFFVDIHRVFSLLSKNGGYWCPITAGTIHSRSPQRPFLGAENQY